MVELEHSWSFLCAGACRVCTGRQHCSGRVRHNLAARQAAGHQQRCRKRGAGPDCVQHCRSASKHSHANTWPIQTGPFLHSVRSLRTPRRSYKPAEQHCHAYMLGLSMLHSNRNMRMRAHQMPPVTVGKVICHGFQSYVMHALTQSLHRPYAWTSCTF